MRNTNLGSLDLYRGVRILSISAQEGLDKTTGIEAQVIESWQPRVVDTGPINDTPLPHSKGHQAHLKTSLEHHWRIVAGFRCGQIALQLPQCGQQIVHKQLSGTQLSLCILIHLPLKDAPWPMGCGWCNYAGNVILTVLYRLSSTKFTVNLILVL